MTFTYTRACVILIISIHKGRDIMSAFNSILAASFTDFMNQTVTGNIKMWMVIAAALVIVVICIILIAIISKSTSKKNKKKAQQIVDEVDDAKLPDRASEPVEEVTPVAIPDAVATTSAPEEVVLTEAVDETAEETAQPVAQEEVPAEEAAPEQEAPVEVPAQEEAPAEEVPAEEVKEEPVTVAADEQEEPKKVVKPAAKKPAPARKPPVRKPAEAKKAEAKAAPAAPADGEAKPAITLLFGEKPDPTSGRYVIVKDITNSVRPYKFQLKANNGQILYESENYKIKPKAKQVETFRNAINNGTSSIDEEKNGTFRYKLFKVDGTLYGVGEGYKSRASAESALESVKKFANSANFIEDLTIVTE